MDERMKGPVRSIVRHVVLLSACKLKSVLCVECVLLRLPAPTLFPSIGHGLLHYYSVSF